jgi:hypothetical protein
VDLSIFAQREELESLYSKFYQLPWCSSISIRTDHDSLWIKSYEHDLVLDCGEGPHLNPLVWSILDALPLGSMISMDTVGHAHIEEGKNQRTYASALNGIFMYRGEFPLNRQKWVDLKIYSSCRNLSPIQVYDTYESILELVDVDRMYQRFFQVFGIETSIN